MTWREYRRDYMTIHVPPGDIKLSIYVPEKEFAIQSHKWCTENGYSQVRSVPTEDGYTQYLQWGIRTEDGRIYVSRINRCFVELRDKQRADWPDAAKQACERYEAKLNELFECLDATTALSERQAEEIRLLKLSLKNSERAVASAEASADEMKRRVRETDPERIRKEAAAEFSRKTEALLEENKRLAAALHEATSQAEKLAEDKRRLRTALHSARGR